MNVQTFGGMFDVASKSPPESMNMRARAELMSALKTHIGSWNLSQQAAATRLGIARPRLNELMRGKLAKFSLDALVNLAPAAGLIVQIAVTAEP